MHVRSQIRAAIFAKLQAVPGLSVFKGRTRPLNEDGLPIEDDDLPGVLVRSGSEEVALDSGTVGFPRQRTRTYTIEVVAISALEDPDDEIDALILLVETTLGSGITLGDIALEITLISTEQIDASDEAASNFSAAVMQWNVLYVVAENNPEQPL